MYKSDHFGVESATFVTFNAVVMELSIHSFVKTFIAQNIHFMVFHFLRKVIFCLVNHFLNVFILLFAQFETCHTTDWTIDAFDLFQTLWMNQVTAWKSLVVFDRIFKHLQANGAFWFGNILIAFVIIFVNSWPAVPTLKAMKSIFLSSSSAHLTIVLSFKQVLTQWKISFFFLGLFSYNMHFRQVYSPNFVLHFSLRQLYEAGWTY